MTGYEAFSLYNSLKLHFTSKSYDYFKYNGKSNLKYDSFVKRNDKIFFQKLAKHEDVINFLIANFSINNKLWIKNLAYSEESENIYKQWLKRQNSLSYIFKQDLSKLDDNFDNNFIINDNTHPKLLKLYFDKFEKELQGTVNEPTTQAYEKIKQTGQSYEGGTGGAQSPTPLAENKKRRLVESKKLYDQIITHLLR